MKRKSVPSGNPRIGQLPFSNRGCLEALFVYCKPFKIFAKLPLVSSISLPVCHLDTLSFTFPKSKSGFPTSLLKNLDRLPPALRIKSKFFSCPNVVTLVFSPSLTPPHSIPLSTLIILGIFWFFRETKPSHLWPQHVLGTEHPFLLIQDLI